MTEHEPFKERRQHKRLLNMAQRDKVLSIAKALLIEDGQLKPGTFFTDQTGAIKYPSDRFRLGHSDADFWRYLNTQFGIERAANPDCSTEAILADFCTQTIYDSRPLFHEKGRFMKRILEVASHTIDEKTGEPLISPREAHHLSEQIPLMRAAVHWEHAPRPHNRYNAAPKPLATEEILPIHRPYKEKLRAIAAGTPQDLFPGEFLHYLLTGRGASRFNAPKIVHLFEKDLEHSEGYLSTNIFQRKVSLPVSLQERLTQITKPDDSYFWDKPSFSSTDADKVAKKFDAYIKQILETADKERAFLEQKRRDLNPGADGHQH